MYTRGQVDKDHIQVWMDGCYRSWKKSHYWALQIAAVVVWLPVALHAVNLALQSKIDPILYVQLSSKLIQLQTPIPVINLLIGLAVATAAASCFKLEPEAEQMSSTQPAFHLLRSNVRKVTYQWLFKLMFIPSLASFLIWYSQLMVPTRFHPIPSHRWEFLFITSFMYFVSCWIGAEFSQYMNLRFNSKPVWVRVSVVVGSAIAYLALITFGKLVFGQNPEGTLMVLSIIFGWIIVLTPVGASLWMMLATRKPAAPMLERL